MQFRRIGRVLLLMGSGAVLFQATAGCETLVADTVIQLLTSALFSAALNAAFSAT